ncbi:LytTR family DNA-binding domain-containing protein [bacterium]|nr:LytTR family DNA-binding domain-containing protein [bacterium]
MLNALIIEDEQASRETLRNYLAKYCSGVTVAGEAANIKEGLSLIREHAPNLIFLDVEMPFGNAFDLLEQVGEPTFETIFVTAYSHYAVKALNVSASYYLLKPIDIDELVASVEKVKKSIADNQQSFHTRILIDNLQTAGKQMQKVVLPILDGFEVVHVKDIIRLQANGNFTDFYLVDGSKKMICRTLKFYDEILSDLDFVRVHKSHLINLQYVKGYKKGKGGQLTMEGGAVVDVSASRKQELLSRF